MTGDGDMPQQPVLNVVPMPERADKQQAMVDALKAGYALFAAGFDPKPGDVVMLNNCAGHLTIPVGTPAIVMERRDTDPVVLDDRPLVMTAFQGTRYDTRIAVQAQDGTLVMIWLDRRLLEPYRAGAKPAHPAPVPVPPAGA